MSRSGIRVHLVADQPEQATPFLRGLQALGFAVNELSPRREDISKVGRNDVFVILGHYGTGANSPARLRTLCGERRDRTVLFLDSMKPDAFAAFEREGFSCINMTTTRTTQSLVSLVAQIDAHAVYQASRTVAMRASMTNRIAGSVVDLFSRLRAKPVAPTLEESSRQRRAMNELIGLSPMSVWIDLIQNYHDGTAQHCSLVSGYALAFGRVLGFGDRETGRLFDAAFFHDVGKAMIPLEILDKPGQLTPDEWEIMKRHVLYSYDILSRDENTAGEIARVARDHHEYLDGSGYPNGIAAAGIDDLTRIITICDIFAALTEKRAYKPPKPPEEAYAILSSMAGQKLDPDLVRIFEKVAVECETGRPALALVA